MSPPLIQSDPAGLTVLIPASNEAGEIGPCLDAVLASHWSARTGVSCLVIANGCQDATVQVAQARIAAFEARGWALTVLDLPEGGKLNALNRGDAQVDARVRVYLDADVRVSPALLQELFGLLDTDAPRYASGRVEIPTPASWITRAYRRIYRQVPFMTTGVPGCGVFAVNAAGRARWGAFPDIIADDSFVRLNFAPNERLPARASYTWPLVEGWSNLVRVRRRQDRGVRELEQRFPEILQNDDKPPFPTRDKLRLALTDPIGFAIYTGVRIFAEMGAGRSQSWSRGR